MWGKFAQGLKENAGELRSGLAKLQDVVAPPAEDGSGSEYEEEEYEEYEEEEEEDEENSRPVLGFGAILSRIVAPEEEEESEEEEFVQVVEPVEEKPVKVSLSRKPVVERKAVERKPSYNPGEQPKLMAPLKKEVQLPARKLLVPTSPVGGTKKNLIPIGSETVGHKGASDKASSQQLQRHLSSMSTQSIENCPRKSAENMEKDVKIAQLERKCKELALEPSVDPAIFTERDAKILKLEERCRLLEAKPSVDPAVVEEKEKKIRDLEEKCKMLESKPVADPSIIAEKEAKILMLQTQYRTLAAKPNMDPLVLKEKEDVIRALEEKCRELELKPSVDPRVVKEKEIVIQKLEMKCRMLEAKPSVDPTLLEKYQRRIAELEVICKELQETPSIDPGIVEAKDERIAELEAECQVLRNKPSVNPAVVERKDNEIFRLKNMCKALQEKRSIDASILREKEAKVAALEEQCKILQETSTVEASVLADQASKISQLEAKCESSSMKPDSDPAAMQEKDAKIGVLELVCQNLRIQLEQQQAESEKSSYAESSFKELLPKFQAVEKKCHELELRLQQREDHILEMQSEAARRMEEEEKWRERQLLKFKQDQAEMIVANAEAVSSEYTQEMERLEQELETRAQVMNDQLGEERMKALQKQRELEQRLEEANSRIALLAADKESVISKHDAASTQKIQKLERAAHKAAQQLEETRAILDSRNDELKALKTMVKELQATMRKAKAEQNAYEEEMEHFKEENETLHHNWQVTEDENEELKKQLDELAGHDEVINELKAEIQKLQEERDRERTDILSKAGDVESSNASLQAARDEALATVRDLQHQMSATLADLEVAKADTQRAMLANDNLNRAMMAFQSERDAEIALLEEQYRGSEEAAAAAHAAAIQATHQANEVKMNELEFAANAAIQKAMNELETVRVELEEVKREKLQTRRSLDEAINRLQASQEDVVDRVLMKNVLLDWFARSGKSKEQVLEMMASMLHFTEDEKEKIHLYGGHARLSKVYESVTALPPRTTDIEKLEGDNVRDKFVNFLLAEAGDL